MILTYFQEASGETVEFFWKEIKRLGLGYKRKNMMVNILRCSNIKDDIEYDFVKDVIMSYLDEGLITDMEFKKLNDMIFTFEQKKEDNFPVMLQTTGIRIRTNVTLAEARAILSSVGIAADR